MLVQSQWKCFLKPQSPLCTSLLFHLAGTAAWWFYHLLTLGIIFAGIVLDSPNWMCVFPAASVILTSSLWKSPTNDIICHRGLGCLSPSAVSAKAYLNKFLQISAPASENTQACYFPPKIEGQSKARLWKSGNLHTGCLLNGDSDKMTYGNIYRLKLYKENL